ncbi:hypothetical protein GYMLUDRAFT_986523 [Collybiopsis luxurians FD-317 M1]|uniref:Uncharacterized protein n=1 Tax=Collybiopsis luxurians FD-317 M1 TaxID=944289 RepID=A0A0D0CVJ5_9AGAR|nr:hypothetical protein GYMLUDRAFT_986523 [Collybiopsis luxurians FD-317 M1]
MTIPSSFDEIVDKQIYLGNLSCAVSSHLLKQLGITHIVSVCPDFPSTGPNHLTIEVDDSDYDDLLIHLPEACQFIQKAIDQGGRVLVHCVMGISRSATVLAAFFMQSKELSSSEALEFIRTRRPCIQPNYGFLKQLEAFAKCEYHPSPENPAYISWKRRQEQDVTLFLNQMFDTIPVIPNRLFLSSDFPDDVGKIEPLLIELGITHLLSIAPSVTIPNIPALVEHRHFSDAEQHRGLLLLVLAEMCSFIGEALSQGGVVLVYSETESKAVLAAYGYLMCSRELTPEQVYPQLTEALPLFNRTSSFTEQLELFDACSYAPKFDHPLIEEWLSTAPPSGWTSRRGSTTQSAAAPLSETAFDVLSETGLDCEAFSKTLQKLQTRDTPRAPPSIHVRC